jgi:hypothetical protein
MNDVRARSVMRVVDEFSWDPRRIFRGATWETEPGKTKCKERCEETERQRHLGCKLCGSTVGHEERPKPKVVGYLGRQSQVLAV